VGEKLDCEHEIGRRIRLRDLHVLLTVSQRGSMAQAAAQLGLSQPAVSGVIAELERTLGVPLFERSTRGVTPTVYARAMTECSLAAFDELKQGIRTIENLADPTAGELLIGCIESVSTLILPPIIQGFMQRYPRVTVHVSRLSPSSQEIRTLCERNLDLVLGPMRTDPANDADLTSEPLIESRVVIAAGVSSPWARRSRLDLADLVDEPWVLTPPECRIHTSIKEAFSARGLPPPQIRLMSFSIPLRLRLAASGLYLTAFPESIRSFGGDCNSITILPIDLPASSAPISIITLRSRNLNPVAKRFIEHLRSYAAAQFDLHPNADARANPA
jgi:DNA-binding transcriptional LysR family regulator